MKHIKWIAAVLVIVLICSLWLPIASAAYLPTPANFRVSQTQATTKLTWNKVSGATYYKVVIIKSSTGKILAEPTTKSTSMTVQNYLTEKTNYTFRLYAYGDGTSSKYTWTKLDNKYIVAKKISLNKSALSMDEDASATLTATISPSACTNKKVTWSSSDASVATVDANGKVTGVAPGTATITAKSHNGLTATCKVTVNLVKIHIEKLALDQTELLLTASGQTQQLKASWLPETANQTELTWASSDPEVATVAKNGLVRAIDNGTAVISVTSASGKMAQCTVTVQTSETVAQAIAMPKYCVVEIGTAVELPVEFSPADTTNKELVWKTSDDSVIEVNDDGTFTTKKAGRAIVQAVSVSGARVAQTLVYVNDQYYELDPQVVYVQHYSGKARLAQELVEGYNDGDYAGGEGDDDAGDAEEGTEEELAPAPSYDVSALDVELEKPLRAEYQRFALTRDSETGYYRIGLRSGMSFLDVQDGRLAWTPYPLEAELWKVSRLFNDTYVIQPASDLTLALTCLSETEIVLYKQLYHKLQRFVLPECGREDGELDLGWPTDCFHITGLDYYFSSGRAHGNAGAMDIGDGQYGWKIFAAEDGTVVTALDTCKHTGGCRCNGRRGNYVKIRHKNGYYTLYLHMKKDSLVVKAGDTVKKGDLLGMMGTSGDSSGVHVHFTLQDQNQKNLYAFDYLLQNSEYVEKITFSGTGPSKGRYYEFIAEHYSRKNGRLAYSGS